MSGGLECSETDVTDSVDLIVPSTNKIKSGERWRRTGVVGVIDAAALDHEVVSIIAACRFEVTQRLSGQLPVVRSGIPSV